MPYDLFRAASDVAEIACNSASSAELRLNLSLVLQRLVGFDASALLSAFPGQPWAVAGEHIDQQKLSENGWRYAEESPPKAIAALTRSFSRDLDVVPASVRDRSSMYREFHAPMGTREWVARTWVIDSRIFSIGLCRSSVRFRPRELASLDSLFPHLAAAMRMSELVGRCFDATLDDFCHDSCLTPREAEVVRLVVRGLRNTEIANLLGIEATTVRNVLAAVFLKTHVGTRAELTYVVSAWYGEPQASESARYHSRLISRFAVASPICGAR